MVSSRWKVADLKAHVRSGAPKMFSIEQVGTTGPSGDPLEDLASG